MFTVTRKTALILIALAAAISCGIFAVAQTVQVQSPARSASHKWIPAAPLMSARSGACAAMLPNGNLMITGGTDGQAALNSAEAMGPDGNFSTTSPMLSARQNHACAALPDGQLLVAGGTTAAGPTNAAEMYSPDQDKWTVTGGLSSARSGASAVTLRDGRILIAGGQGSGGPVNSIEIYDQAKGVFTTASAVLTSPRTGHAAALLRDGRVVIAGGSNGSAPLNTIDIFDPATGSVSSYAALSTPRVGLSATTLLTGDVLFAGGNDGQNDLATAEVLNVNTGKLGSPIPMSAPRTGHSAVALPNNNTVLIVGGTSAGVPMSATELFVPWQSKFQPAGLLGLARTGSAAVPLQAVNSGTLLLAGGSTAAVATPTAEKFSYPTLTSDKSNYFPGDTIVLTGKGWAPNEVVTIVLTVDPATHAPVTLKSTADRNGNFTNSQYVDQESDLGVTFTATATGATGDTAAALVFTDACSAGACYTVTVSPTTSAVGTGATFTVTFTIPTSNTAPTGRVSITLPTANYAISSTSTNPTVTGTCTNNSACSGTNWTMATASGTVTAASTSNSKYDIKAGSSGTIQFTINATAISATGSPITWATVGNSSHDTNATTLNNSASDPSITITGAATKLAFSTSAVSVAVGACSGVITVQSQNSGGTATDPSSTETITLSSTDGSSATYYSNNTCTTAITGVSIASTANSASFYFKDTKAGSPTITATGTGAFSSAPTQTETVTKATPTVSTWPTASAITYGQTLASSTLTGGTGSVGGTFAFTTPTTQPATGTASQSVTFTPTDTTDYNTVVGSVSVTVNKATPTVSTWPTASAITYGQTLASSTLTGGTGSVGGTFAFTTPTTQPAVGTASQSVTFTPTDTTDYNTAVGSVSVTVNKAAPTVTTWPTASAITYGQTLASSTLTGGTGSVGGTFAFTTPTTAPGAGTANQSVTFTPTDTTDYNTVVSTISVTVNKATPTVTTWPTAGAITYGQTLASSTLTGGTGSVGGTFAFTTPTTAPGAGNFSASVTFTPTDTTDYNTVASMISVTVNKATPTVTTWPTASAITYGQALSASTLSGGLGSVGGTFAFTTPTTVPGAGTANQSVTFTPTDTTDYNTVVSMISVTVNKATPTVTTWPTASAITYGQVLSASTLSGGTGSVGGTFAFTTPTTVPGAGNFSASVTFTPTDTTDYNTVVSTISVTVNKATPTVTTWPTASAITYGQALSASTLSGGTGSVGGTFAFTTPTTVPGAGTANQSVTFTPTDTTDYNTLSGSVSVTVNKATPTVTTWPTASAITYGQALSASTLSGGTGSVGGTFAFTTPTTVPGAGTANQSVTFTPTDATDYNTLAGSVSVTVNKATPTVTTWPTASAITYGQALSASTLSGGTGSVGGTFAFTTPTTVPGAGTANQPVTFTPTDATDYNTLSGSVSVTVNKATPTVTTWPTASAITYGQALSASTLSGGTASVGGTFAFTTPSTSPGAGVANQSVTFTPTDTTDYSTVVSTVSVTVNKVTPTVTTWPTASAITYGQTLASSTLTGGLGSVGGTFAFTTPSTQPAAGVANQSVTFTPTDTTDYSTVVSTLSVTVNKATPTVTTWPAASAITYGQTLASSTLTGGSGSVGGTFAFTTPSTQPGLGTANQSVTFTPTDATDYNTLAGSVSVTVNKGTPTVTTWPIASAITYGQTLASSTLTGGSASVGGTFAFTTPSTQPGLGTANQSVTFTPTDATDYNTLAGSVSVTVNKATPAVNTWPTASAITYGQTLASSTLTGGSASVGGTFAFTTPSTVPGAGVASQSVTFTPTDTTDYSTVVSTVSVTVNKATPTVTTWPTAGAITYGQTLASSTLTGGLGSVGGTFAFTAPSTQPGAGTASQPVTFTPTDATDYNTVSGSVSVTVNKATPTVNTWPTAGAITYGQTLASSTLTGGSASVGGTFAFTTPSTQPGLGVASQSVTFTPADTTDYSTVVSTVSVSVNMATPTVTTWPTASAITYGQILASSTLTGGTASVGGTFAFTTPSIQPGAGVANQSVTFTPADTTDYGTVVGSVSVMVNKATPTVTTWPTAGAITYGQTLASSTLTGGLGSVGGTFAFTTPLTQPGAGTASQSVTFTPADTTDYNTVVNTVSVTVNKATPTVNTWPTAGPITYGQTLASSTLTGGTGSVGGTFAFTTPSTQPGLGVASQSVTFTPTDTTDYNTVVSTVSVTVNKATPTVTMWPTASAIIYGQTLASSTLAGGSASVGGTFAFTTPSTAPGAGVANQSVTFTPTDTTDYGTVVSTVSVTVNKATPAVSAWPTAGAITYGQTLASSTLTGGLGSVGGTFAFTTPSTQPAAGVANQSVTFTPADATDYNTVVSTVSVTVNKATPAVSTWPTAGAITYGQTLASSTLTGGSANVGGTFAFTTPTSQPGAPGTYSYSVTFTPTDTLDYVTVAGVVNVPVVSTLVTTAGNTRMSLNWVSYGPDTYTIQYSTDGISWTVATQLSGSTAAGSAMGYVVTGLTNGTKYSFQVIPTGFGAMQAGPVAPKGSLLP